MLCLCLRVQCSQAPERGRSPGADFTSGCEPSLSRDASFPSEQMQHYTLYALLSFCSPPGNQAIFLLLWLSLFWAFYRKRSIHYVANNFAFIVQYDSLWYAKASLLLFKILLHVFVCACCVCVCVCICAHACMCTYVGQGKISVLPPRRSWGWNSGHQSWQQVAFARGAISEASFLIITE